MSNARNLGNITTGGGTGATTASVTTSINNLIDAAPGALNTLNELAAALGDDANFSTTVTNSIATKLSLAGGTMTGDLVVTKNSAAIQVNESSGATTKLVAGGSLGYVGTYSNHSLQLLVNSTPKLVIDTNGDVGIGTTGPNTKLHVKSGGAGNSYGSLYLEVDTATNYPAMVIQTASGGNATETHGLYIKNTAAGYGLRIDDTTSDTSPFVVDTEGRVGIGTASPGTKLHIDGGGSQPELRVAQNSTYFTDIGVNHIDVNGPNDLRFLMGGAQKARLTSGGVLALGSGTPGSWSANYPALTIGQGATLTGHASNTQTQLGQNWWIGTGNQYIVNGAASRLVMNPDSTIIFSQAPSGTANATMSTTNDRLVINPSGYVGIGVSSPFADLTVGTSTAFDNGDNYVAAVFQPAINGGESAGMLFGHYPASGYAKMGIFWERYVGASGSGGRGKLHFVNRDATDTSVPTTADTRMTIDEAGNVGIGTTGPASLLHIKSSTVDARLQLTNSASADDTTSSGASFQLFNDDLYINAVENSGNIILRTDGGGGFVERMRITSSGNVGIGTSTPANPLDVQGADSGIIVRSAVANRPHIKLINGTTTMLQLSANGTYGAIGDGTDANRYMSFKDGKVGINTTSPGFYLHVVGGTRFAGSNNDVHGQVSVHGTSGGDAQIAFLTDLNGRAIYVDNDDTNKMKFSTGYGKGVAGKEIVMDNNAHMGIGTTSPSSQLHVHGGSATNYIRIENGGSGNMGGIYLKTADNSDLSKYFRQQAYYTEIGAHNNEGVRFDFQGTRRYTFRGSNGGNVCYNAQNSSNWNTTSDERIKTNIKTLEDGAIDKIKALRPVTFDYTDEWAEHKDLHKITNAPGKTEAEHYNITDHGIDEEKQKGQIGWIAQEYKTVFPSDVTIGEDTVGETKYHDFHTLNPESVVPTLVKALQEAVAKIDALETRIKTLES